MRGCRTCTNWQAMDQYLERIDPATSNQNAQLGRCRRYAPRPLTPEAGAGDAGTRPDSVWPCVASDDWCGEWDPKMD